MTNLTIVVYCLSLVNIRTLHNVHVLYKHCNLAQEIENEMLTNISNIHPQQNEVIETTKTIRNITEKISKSFALFLVVAVVI